MKKRVTGIMLLLLFFAGTASAQYFVHKNQYRVMWGSAGYSLCNHSIQSINSTGNLGLTLGIGKEWKNSKNYYYLTGLELNFISNTNIIEDFTDTRTLIDTDNSSYNEFEFHSKFSKCAEKNNFLYLNIPLMAGYVFQYAYISAGSKIGASLYSNYVTTTNLTTSGDYEWFINEFHNMPNHFFVEDKPIRDKNSMGHNFNIILSAEIGRYWLETNRNELRVVKVAAFIDYGLLNMMSGVEQSDNYLRYNENPIDYQFSSVYGINKAQNISVRSLFTGVKICYLINKRKGWFCEEKDGLCF